MDQLSLFREKLPYKPYSSDILQYGVHIRNAQEAVKSRYIQHNQPTKKHWLCFDIDHAGASFEWQSLGLPAPNISVENPDNKHAHLLYGLEIPVVTSERGRMKPLRYAGAVEHAMALKLDADMAYSGLLCKNPLNNHWNVNIWNDYSYDLNELADYVDLQPYKDRRKRLPDYGIGRNCNLFDKTRMWAYRAIRERDYPEFNEWFNAVHAKAIVYNNDFIESLPYPEVKAVVKSISKWTHRYINQRSFQSYVDRTHTSEIQKERNSRSLAVRQGKAGEKAQLLLDLMDKHPDKSITELSALSNIPRRTAYRIIKNIEVCHLPISDNSL